MGAGGELGPGPSGQRRSTQTPAAGLAQSCPFQTQLPGLCRGRDPSPNRLQIPPLAEAPGAKDGWAGGGWSGPARRSRGLRGSFKEAGDPLPRVALPAGLWGPSSGAAVGRGPHPASGRRRDPPATRSPPTPGRGRERLAPGVRSPFPLRPPRAERFRDLRGGGGGRPRGSQASPGGCAPGVGAGGRARGPLRPGPGRFPSLGLRSRRGGGTRSLGTLCRPRAPHSPGRGSPAAVCVQFFRLKGVYLRVCFGIAPEGDRACGGEITGLPT